jgi:hypothetical protein
LSNRFTIFFRMKVSSNWKLLQQRLQYHLLTRNSKSTNAINGKVGAKRKGEFKVPTVGKKQIIEQKMRRNEESISDEEIEVEGASNERDLDILNEVLLKDTKFESLLSDVEEEVEEDRIKKKAKVAVSEESKKRY